MAAPVVTAVTEGSWVKVATNVQDVAVNIITRGGVVYSWTYRDTGVPAPTLANEQIYFDRSISLHTAAGVDVYVWCKNGDGSVRVDAGLNVTYLIDG